MAPPTKKPAFSPLYLAAIITTILCLTSLAISGPLNTLLATCPRSLIHSLTTTTTTTKNGTPCECAVVLAATTVLSTAFWAAATSATLLLPGTTHLSRASVAVGALVHAVLCVVVVARGGHREAGDCARFYVGGQMTLLVGLVSLVCAVLHARVGDWMRGG